MARIHIRSIRPVVHNHNHNAFTGACWFRGNLFVAYRQGLAHVCSEGRIVVQRSRNEGVHFEPVAVIRGAVDTRDAHLYQAGGRRLFVAGFEADTESKPRIISAGCAYTDDGDRWTPWIRYTGADGFVMWRPTHHAGRFYCAGYDFGTPGTSKVAWFESLNGIDWKMQSVIHEGADQPNEVYPWFERDGSLVALMRREHKSRRPILLRSKPPYTHWEKTELDIPLAGPCLWTVGGEVYISGRWFPTPTAAHTAIFRVVGDKPVLQVVLPSGPDFDHSYMSVAPWPNNSHRLGLAYYANHQSCPDPSIAQQDHPGVYFAEACFEGGYITRWRRSTLRAGKLSDTACPRADDAAMGWTDIRAAGDDLPYGGMVAEHEYIAGRQGVLCFDTELEIGPCDRGRLHLGNDGPVTVWLNGEQVYTGPGNNPAIPDRVSIDLKTRHGKNRLAIALDTNGGKAWGFYARFEPLG